MTYESIIHPSIQNNCDIKHNAHKGIRKLAYFEFAWVWMWDYATDIWHTHTDMIMATTLGHPGSNILWLTCWEAGEDRKRETSAVKQPEQEGKARNQHDRGKGFPVRTNIRDIPARHLLWELWNSICHSLYLLCVCMYVFVVQHWGMSGIRPSRGFPTTLSAFISWSHPPFEPYLYLHHAKPEGS